MGLRNLWSPGNCDRGIALLSLPGLGVSTYLTVTEVMGEAPACGLASGCATVTSSEFAYVGGAPVSLMGMLFYSFILIFALTLIVTGASEHGPARRFLLLSSGIGLGFSAYLMVAATAIIGSFCVYCTTSATLVTAIFLLSVLAWVGGTGPVRSLRRTPSTSLDTSNGS